MVNLLLRVLISWPVFFKTRLPRAGEEVRIGESDHCLLSIVSPRTSLTLPLPRPQPLWVLEAL